MTLRPRNCCALLILLVLGVYYPAIFSPFNSLDDQRLVHHLLNQGEFSLSSQFFPGGASSYYRPLVTLTYQFDRFAWGLQESFMHLDNILLHMANTLLVYGLCRLLAGHIGRKPDLLPFIAAALFAVHPINTESVNWISARTDLMAATGVYASLVLLLEALHRKSHLLLAGSALCLLAGALSKESALFVAPGFLLFLTGECRAGDSAWRQRWTAAGYFLIGLSIYAALRWFALHQDTGVGATVHVLTAAPASSSDPVSSTAAGFPVLDAVRVILKAVGFYAVKLLQPLPLNFAHVKISPLYLVPGGLVMCALPVMLVRRRPVTVLYLLAFMSGIAALLVIFTQSAWTPVAERYMYIPCGFFVSATVFGCASLSERFRCERPVIVLTIILALVAVRATVSRTIVWQDNLTLYQDTVRKSPDFPLAKNELALALLDRGRVDEANALLIANRPTTEQRASLNRAVALAKENRYPDARRLLVERLESEHNPELKSRALDILVSLSLDEAAKMSPGDEQRRLYRDIIVWLEQLHTLTRSSFQWYRMGRVHLLLNDKVAAQRCFAEAAVQLPKHSPFKEPAARLARTLGKQ